MICLVSPNGHGDVIFSFVTNSKNVILDSYESKSSTEIRIEVRDGVTDIVFFEDGEKTDRWPVSKILTKKKKEVYARFPQIQTYKEGVR